MATNDDRFRVGGGTPGGVQVVTPQCRACKWADAKDPFACRAFPDGIPSDILLNEVDHRKPVKGDKGIRFTPMSGERSPFVR